MRRVSLSLVLAVGLVTACQDSLTGPYSNLRAPAKAVSTESEPISDPIIDVANLVGTWQATKALGESALKPGSQRDLVAEGGTVTLVLEWGQLENPANWPRYSITVAMPGAEPGVDTGRWYYSEYSIEIGCSEYPQIDFYPASLGQDIEYGQVPAFLVSLSGDTLKLWDSGLTFLPFDFGWPPSSTALTLEFTRK